MVEPGGVIYPNAFLDDMTVKSSVKFEQHHRALSRLQTSGYNFIMKTWTDVVIQRPMAFTTAMKRCQQISCRVANFLGGLDAARAICHTREAILSWFTFVSTK
jgi:hypothetical protein